MRASTALLIPSLLLACAGNPDPVPVSGEPADLQALAGEWAGEYGSSETARSGSIVFRLEAGRDTATGDVVMIPSGARAPLHPMHGDEIAEQNIPASQLLTIRFVQVHGGSVGGELQPYHDPVCDCAVHTTFTGRLAGDSVTGTYNTSGAGGERRTSGWWRVVRR
jgi:hypothetical protein